MIVVDSADMAVARQAAVDEAGGSELVGEHLGTDTGGGIASILFFDCTLPGYPGWRWSVTLARWADGAAPTVSEVVLLPGPEALLAPGWVPWDQRVRAGDLGVDDLLPAPPDDPRLVPAYVASDDPAIEDLAHEVGVGRVRVLGRDGRLEIAERWHDGAFGPGDEIAVHAPGHCATCAFYLPLAGSLGAAFGVCGNEYSPADGHAVDVGYGCGAHSETVVGPFTRVSAGLSLDELRLEIHHRPEPSSAADRLPGTGEDAAGAAGVPQVTVPGEGTGVQRGPDQSDDAADRLQTEPPAE